MQPFFVGQDEAQPHVAFPLLRVSDISGSLPVAGEKWIRHSEEDRLAVQGNIAVALFPLAGQEAGAPIVVRADDPELRRGGSAGRMTFGERRHGYLSGRNPPVHGIASQNPRLDAVDPIAGDVEVRGVVLPQVDAVDDVQAVRLALDQDISGIFRGIGLVLLLLSRNRDVLALQVLREVVNGGIAVAVRREGFRRGALPVCGDAALAEERREARDVAQTYGTHGERISEIGSHGVAEIDLRHGPHEFNSDLRRAAHGKRPHGGHGKRSGV